MSDLHDSIAMVETSQFFDVDWYLQRYPDVGQLGISAAEHYVRLGAGLLRDPGPLFNARHYLHSNPDVAASRMNPLVHFLAVGKGQGRTCVAVSEPETAEIKLATAVTVVDTGRDIGILRGNVLFDASYYVRAYPDVKKHGMDPLHHFVNHGAREGRQPNPWFSTRFYRATYQARGDDTNPLIHYLSNPHRGVAKTSAHFDGGFYSSRYADFATSSRSPLEHYLTTGVLEGRQTTFATPAHASTARIVDCRVVKTTVIVPVYNALRETLACIDSILRHTTFSGSNRLLIIDDASTDPAVREELLRFSGHPAIRVVTNPSNLGYTRTINKGCELADSDDVVLLNSDTMVGPQWLRNLKVAAYRTDRTGTVTAVSNNAGVFSVPYPGTNEIPDELEVDEIARIVAGCRFNTPFEVPTGNGFCLYIKRLLINDIGLFDAENFPVGYGEENEFCMRALMVGWCHRVDPSTYVGHVRSASFGDRKHQLAEAGMQRLREMYPEYVGAVRGIGISRNFEIARDRIARKLEACLQTKQKPKPRIMFVISTRVGGTPQTNADLMHALADDYECYALWSDCSVIEILKADGTEYKTLERFPLTAPIHFATHVSGEYDDTVRSILADWGIELLHIRHLAWHSLNLVDIAKSLDIPVAFSFHDFYMVCPSVTLIGEDGAYHPSGVTAHVRNPLWRQDPTDTGMNEAWLNHWKQRMQRVLAKCDVFITTCQSAKEIVSTALPLLTERSLDFHVIPHGRDFDQFTQLADDADINSDEPLRILLPGNIGLHKGLELIKGIKRLDTTGSLEFHLLGNGGFGLAEYVIDHGSYKRPQFAERVAAIRPHIAAILSVFPETHCHTLTECWSCGIPVIGIDLGAVGARLRKHGGGWAIAHPTNTEVAYIELMKIRSTKSDRKEKAFAVAAWQRGEGHSNSTTHMGDQYLELYRQLRRQSAIR